MDPLNQYSLIKQYAIKTLNCFDDLARPEIKNALMDKVWNFVKNRTFKIILRKPDEELKIKLFQVHKTLGPLFSDVDLDNAIKEGEALGSPKVPNVGELKKLKALTPSAEEVLRELNF